MSDMLPFTCFRGFSNDIVIGLDTSLGENVCIEPNVKIGKNCRIGCNTVIRNGVVIGDGCDIGHLVLIEEGTVIGNKSTVQSQCHITAYATIEECVFFGPNVTCVNDTKMVKYHPERGEFVCRGPIFQSGSSIGAGSLVLPGVNIGKDCIIGGGSVVTKNVPDGETWFGPCAKSRKK